MPKPSRIRDKVSFGVGCAGFLFVLVNLWMQVRLATGSSVQVFAYTVLLLFGVFFFSWLIFSNIRTNRDIYGEEHPEEGVKYYAGEYIDRWLTPGGNLIIKVAKAKYINIIPNNNDLQASIEFKDAPNALNFLVPRRRERVFGECRSLSIGDLITVKLVRESRSGKYAVAEVGQQEQHKRGVPA